MKTKKKIGMLIIVFSILIMSNCSYAQNSSEQYSVSNFNANWIRMQPEVLTYNIKGKNNEGLLQVSIAKTNDTLEVFTNIMTKDFMKVVWGKMTMDMKPIESVSKIVIDKRIMFDTKCDYNGNNLLIETMMKPYGKVSKENIESNNPIIDFSQIAILIRMLNYANDIEYTFNSLDPQKNKLIPLSIQYLGEESINEIVCNKIEKNDFEGLSIYWVEKESPFRVIRIEQPKEKQVTQLIL